MQLVHLGSYFEQPNSANANAMPSHRGLFLRCCSARKGCCQSQSPSLPSVLKVSASLQYLYQGTPDGVEPLTPIKVKQQRRVQDAAITQAGPFYCSRVRRLYQYQVTPSLLTNLHAAEMALSRHQTPLKEELFPAAFLLSPHCHYTVLLMDPSFQKTSRMCHS